MIGAGLDNGLLHVDLRRIVLEPEVRTIKIQGGAGTKKAAKTIDVESN